MDLIGPRAICFWWGGLGPEAKHSDPFLTWTSPEMLLFVVEKGKSIPLPTSKNKDYHNCLTTHLPYPKKLLAPLALGNKIFATLKWKSALEYIWWPFHHDHPTFLSPCDFFPWNYVKELVFVPLLPANIEEMKQRITAALETVIKDMLQRVWHEFEYRLDGCRVTGGAQIEHL